VFGLEYGTEGAGGAVDEIVRRERLVNVRTVGSVAACGKASAREARLTRVAAVFMIVISKVMN